MLTLRTKLALIVALMAVAIGAVWAIGMAGDRRQNDNLSTVEARLVPKLELGPALAADMQALAGAFRDAAAAQDRDLLEESSAIRDRLERRIIDAEPIIGGVTASLLLQAVHDYDGAARQVTGALIDDAEAGAGLMSDMQSKQRRALSLIEEHTALGPDELTEGFAAVRRAGARASRWKLAVGLAALSLIALLALWVGRRLLRSLAVLCEGFERFGAGNFTEPIEVATNDELASVAREANRMAGRLHEATENHEAAEWLESGRVSLAEAIGGVLGPVETANQAIAMIAEHVDARAGALYERVDGDRFEIAGSYALAPGGAEPGAAFALREGLIGQVATGLDVLVVDDLPPSYMAVSSGLGQAPPEALVLVPLPDLDGEITGVIELAMFTPPAPIMLEYLTSSRDLLAIRLHAAHSRRELHVLLDETRRQAQRLTDQEDELRATNDELLAQQTELQNANHELESQQLALAAQNTRLESQAEQLGEASKYKSDFLANMSHELRTPLNSMLLLSHLLSKNSAGNLTDKQVEQLKTVNTAGRDLLDLINQILDLAKIESGKQEVNIESFDARDLGARLEAMFAPLAADKNLKLVLDIDPRVPPRVASDRQRVERILVNLIGNAIKFTAAGSVTLAIDRRDGGGDPRLVMTVTDTGIGIPEQARESVFQSFQQADSNIDRRFGGSGLGLAIARESARLLGGELSLAHSSSEGSTFVCEVPDRERAPAAARPGNRVLLIVDDDPVMSEQIADIARAQGLHPVVASTGERGLQLARELTPDGIVLDVTLPSMDGWTVIDQLRRDRATRDIPVQFVSGIDAPERGLALGAVGYLVKPAPYDDLVSVVRDLAGLGGERRILVVEDDASTGRSLVELLADAELAAIHVPTAASALGAVERESFSCVILDLGLPDMDGLELLDTLVERADIETPPVVVYSGRSLSGGELRRLRRYASAVVVKDGRSIERLLDEITRVRDERAAPEPAAAPVQADVRLDGRKILVADDDMRTAYSLTALLASAGADVIVADNGREALDLLGAGTRIDAVLMDIMMPELDGYETMRRLRAVPQLQRLPVIALTAKAMKGERERCLAAGASDYLPKPVDGDQLLVRLDGWLGESA